MGIPEVRPRERFLVARAECVHYPSLRACLDAAEEEESYTRHAFPHKQTEVQNFRFRAYRRTQLTVRMPKCQHAALLTDWSLRQFCKLVGLRFGELGKLSAKLAAEVLEDRLAWVYEDPEAATDQYEYLVPVLAHDGANENVPRLRALLSLVHQRVPDAHLLEALIHFEGEHLDVVRCRRGERDMHICMVNPRVTAKVGGVRLQPGMFVRNSDVGCGNLEMYRVAWLPEWDVFVPLSSQNRVGRFTSLYRTTRRDVDAFLMLVVGAFTALREQQDVEDECARLTVAAAHIETERALKLACVSSRGLPIEQRSHVREALAFAGDRPTTLALTVGMIRAAASASRNDDLYLAIKAGANLFYRAWHEQEKGSA